MKCEFSQKVTMEQSLRAFLYNSNTNEIRDMLCSICNRYLSVPPIFYNNKLGNICGRCEESSEVCEAKKLKNKKAIMERQKVFESIARYLTFPCSYRNNGCNADLSWEVVAVHERDCTFKKTVCFLSDKEFLEGEEEPCEWTGEPRELVSHFSKKHTMYHTSNPRVVLGLEASSILGPLFGTDIITYEPKFQSKVFSFEVFESVAIGILHYYKIRNTYFCYILTDLSNQNCKLLEYQLELFDDAKKSSVVLPRSEVQSLRNNFHGKASYDNVLEIDLNYMNKLLKMPHFITAEFRMMKKHTPITYIRIPTLRNSTAINQLFDAKFIDNMKCNSCEIYLSQPIYLCVNGHNICKDCRTDADCSINGDDVCNICSNGWSDGERNFAMEKLTSLINYPCKNRFSGCGHMAPIQQITDHEKICPIFHKSRNCFFRKCSWHGTNFRAHIREKHRFFTTDKFYQLKDQQCCFTFDNDTFALEMEICDDNSLKYMVVCCGLTDLKYCYELEMIEGDLGAKTTSKFIVNQLCQPEYTLFDSEAVQIYVPFMLLTQLFLNCAEVKFKINIFPLQDD